MRYLKQRLSVGEVSPAELAAYLTDMERAHASARDGYIMYLKHSGERITDLRSLPTEELRTWFTRVREVNEREARRRKELLEQQRRGLRR